MKKTLIALAALAATVGAHAQSSVTLYGIVDGFVGQTSATAVGGAKLSQAVVNTSGLQSSRWGVRGTEDLGGGLAAVFTAEAGFDTSTGANANTNAQGGTAFGRQVFVGLTGGFGTVALGRQLTAYDALRGATNNTFDANVFSTTSNVWGFAAGQGTAGYSNRSNNAVTWKSPDFAGFSGAVSYGFGEDKTAATSASSNANFHVKYANGPLLVGFAHQREKQALGTTYFSTVAATGIAPAAATAETRKYNLLAGSYDFGVAKLTAGYNTARNGTFKDKDYQFGVSVPFGAASVAFGYSHAKAEATGISNKQRGYSILGLYDLSKRTAFYAGLESRKLTTAGGQGKNSTAGVGVRHSF